MKEGAPADDRAGAKPPALDGPDAEPRSPGGGEAADPIALLRPGERLLARRGGLAVGALAPLVATAYLALEGAGRRAPTSRARCASSSRSPSPARRRS